MKRKKQIKQRIVNHKQHASATLGLINKEDENKEMYLKSYNIVMEKISELYWVLGIKEEI